MSPATGGARHEVGSEALACLGAMAHIRRSLSINKELSKVSPASPDERIAKMTFSSVYPHDAAKVEKKDRTVAELHRVIE